MTYNCDKCGNATDVPKTIVSKQPKTFGKKYLAYECQSGCMNGTWKYSFFPPRDKSQSSLPSMQPQTATIVPLKNQGAIDRAIQTQKEGYLEFKLSKIEKKIDSILSLLTKPEEVVEPITE